ncbi:MAG: methionine aminotransferase [Bacteroidia bacterium]|nr:methionine aminotransferase [Bacteroidia bacterium]
MTKVTSRLPDVGTTIFTVMSRMAQACGAINLSQGFPDFPIDATLVGLVEKYMREGLNQYAPMPGLPALREAIAGMLSVEYQRPFDSEQQITVTAGGTEGLYAAIAALIHQGDEVILFDPSYDSYGPAIRLNGGVPVHINLAPPDFAIDWQAVASRVTPRTRMTVINTPHNPTGAVWSTTDLRQLESLAEEHDLIVLSDEVYERIIFDGHLHQGVLRSASLRDRSVAVFSFGKTFHATGWKVGYVVASAALTTEIRKTHQFLTFSVNTPVQAALAEYLENKDHYTGLGIFYQKKRDYFLHSMKGSSLEPLASHGSYFQLFSYRHLSKEADTQMAETLTRNNLVASIPVSVFYRDGTDHRLLRFCFAKQEETLLRAAEILRKL